MRSYYYVYLFFYVFNPNKSNINYIRNTQKKYTNLFFKASGCKLFILATFK